MNRTTVEEIKARLPIDEVIGGYIKLEKSGKSLKAKCPFHNEKSPSFFVSPDRGGYYCFGCGAKGDIFSFVEQFEGLDFRGALKVLAERAGVPLVYDQKADSEKDRMYAVMELATKYFEASLTKSREAQEYLKSRGITDKSIREFRIGFATSGWRNLLDFLHAKKVSDMLAEKTGLIKRKENEKDFYDRFRGRIMFPIMDSSGRVIAFSGRILPTLDDGKVAKYLNSPDTPLYDKSTVLYGLDKAKSEIRRMGYTIFVEGQMDLVMSHQAGIRNTVASSGTAMTDEVTNQLGIVSNLGLVKRLSNNLIIAFDSDSAGRKAAIRASGIALSLGMDVKIADIVDGKDPADLVREDLNKWKEVLRKAKPVVEFELDNVLTEVSDNRKRVKTMAERVLPLLAKMESASDQSYFVTMIADRVGIPTDALWQDLRTIEQKIKREASTTPLTRETSNMASTIPAKNKANISSKIDLAERQLFGIIFLMEKNESMKAREYLTSLRKIAGNSYDTRAKRAEMNKNDLMFEAEKYFGNDETRFEIHMKELLHNFEADIVDEDLMLAMQDLRKAEKAGDHNAVSELAKKCQVLSIRKGELAKINK